MLEYSFHEVGTGSRRILISRFGFVQNDFGACVITLLFTRSGDDVSANGKIIISRGAGTVQRLFSNRGNVLTRIPNSL